MWAAGSTVADKGKVAELESGGGSPKKSVMEDSPEPAGGSMVGQAKGRTFFSIGHVKRTVSWAAADTGTVLAAYSGSYAARAVTTPLDYSHCSGFMVFVIGVTLTSLYICGVYHRIWSRTSGHDVGILLKAVAWATLVILIADVSASGARPLPLSVVLLGNLLSLVGFVAVRYRGRLPSGLSWRWRAIWFHEFPVVPTRVLIVGAGEVGQVTAWRLKHRSPPDTNYCVVGFVDEDPCKHGMYVEGCQVLGDCHAIPRLVRQYQVDLITIAVHPVSGPEFRQILSCCESTDARIKVIPDIFELLSRQLAVPLLRDIQPEDFLGRSAIGRHPAVDLGPVTHKNILVTGAAGSIGSELSRQLLTYDPIKLILLDNNESALHDLVIDLGNHVPPGADCLVPVLADVASRMEMNGVFARYKPHVVFHSAAYKHVPMLEYYPYKAVQVNVNGTRWTAELARYHGAERFVLISSDKAVSPANVMGATKRICELLLVTLSRQGGGHTLFTSVRFGNVLGSRGSVVPTFNRQIDAGGPVTVTDREMRRYFMTIPEAANLVIHAACLTRGGDLFMLNMGDEVRIVDLAERMIRMRGLRPYEDIEIKFTGARPGEKLCEELHSDSEIPRPTSHPDIFQLTGENLTFEPIAFMSQLDELRSVQFWDDDRVRSCLSALAYFSQTEPESEVIPRTVPGHIPGWVASARTGENVGAQRQVPFGG